MVRRWQGADAQLRYLIASVASAGEEQRMLKMRFQEPVCQILRNRLDVKVLDCDEDSPCMSRVRLCGALLGPGLRLLGSKGSLTVVQALHSRGDADLALPLPFDLPN